MQIRQIRGWPDDCRSNGGNPEVRLCHKLRQIPKYMRLAFTCRALHVRRRSPSPFESLIENTSQPAEPTPPQQESKVAKSDGKETPSKSKECKAAEPSEDAKPAIADDETPVDEIRKKVDGKIAKSEVAGDIGDSIQA